MVSNSYFVLVVFYFVLFSRKMKVDTAYSLLVHATEYSLASLVLALLRQVLTLFFLLLQ